MRIYLGLNRNRLDSDSDEWFRVDKIMSQFGHVVIAPCIFSIGPIAVFDNLELISECDAVAMLDGWETCKACKLEAAYAEYNGIQCSGWRDYVEVVA